MDTDKRRNKETVLNVLMIFMLIAIGLFWWLAPEWLPVWVKIAVTLGVMLVLGGLAPNPASMSRNETSNAVPTKLSEQSSGLPKSRGTKPENRQNTTWVEVKLRYSQYISGDPVDDRTFPRVRLNTFYRDYGHADSVLSCIDDETAEALQPKNEGISKETGELKYHVVHEGSLTGKQIQDYLVTVVRGGGEVWEVLL